MESKHTFVVLPFNSDVLSDPSSLLPAIYHSALHSTQSCTVIFSSPSPETQLYPQLRKHPRRHWAEFQTFLGKVYAVLAAGQWRAERVLMDVEVHFEGEEGDWSDKLLYASESDKRLIILEGYESLPALLPVRSLLGAFVTYVHPYAKDTATPQSHSGQSEPSRDRNESPYPVTALGGTFDHLHAAHKLLLHLALFLTSRKLIVGIMSHSLLTSKSNSELVEPLQRRISQVHDFLSRCHGSGVEFDVVEIHDPFGPTAWDSDIQCLVVSKETMSGGKAVNAKRQEKGLGQLDVSAIDVIASTLHEEVMMGTGDGGSIAKDLSAEDDEGKLKELKMGSTAIRQWIRDHSET